MLGFHPASHWVQAAEDPAGGLGDIPMEPTQNAAPETAVPPPPAPKVIAPQRTAPLKPKPPRSVRRKTPKPQPSAQIKAKTNLPKKAVTKATIKQYPAGIQPSPKAVSKPPVKSVSSKVQASPKPVVSPTETDADEVAAPPDEPTDSRRDLPSPRPIFPSPTPVRNGVREQKYSSSPVATPSITVPTSNSAELATPVTKHTPLPTKPRKLIPKSNAISTNEIQMTAWGGSLSFGYPHPLMLSLERRRERYWSGSFGAGWFSLPIGSDNLKTWSAQLTGRWHPFENAFFVGSSLGFQSFDYSASAPVTLTVNPNPSISGNVTSTGGTQSVYLAPHLGWNWIWNSGFSLGVDAGVLIPLTTSTSLSYSSDNAELATKQSQVESYDPSFQSLESNVQARSKDWGGRVVPYFTLLRVGYYF